MKFEPKHLYPYLIHGLRVNVYKKDGELYIENEPFLDLNPNISGPDVHIISNGTTKWIFYLEAIKPILRPLSDLTKEIEHNGDKFVPMDELNKMDVLGRYIDYVPLSDTWLMGTNRDGEINLNSAYRRREKLFKWHFDVFNLIDNDLAIKK